MKLITQYVTQQQIDALQAITDKTGIKRAELIRAAIEEFLKKGFK
jgi:hypothetical protein